MEIVDIYLFLARLLRSNKRGKIGGICHVNADVYRID